MTLNFELSLEETNVILSALSKQSFETVATIINKIQAQAAPQVTPSNKGVESGEKKLKKA